MRRAVAGLRERAVSAFSKAPWPLRLLFCLALMQYVGEGLFLGFFSNGFDFALVHEAAAKVLSGRGAAIYDRLLSFQMGGSTLFYMYPPVVALLYAPFGLLPLPAAWTLFQFLSHAALWGALALWIRPRDAKAQGEKGLLIFSLVFLFFPVYFSLQLGQSEPLVLCCLLLSFHLHKKGNFFLAGLCLAAAIYLKLFLAFFLVFHALRREYKSLGWCLFWLVSLAGASLLAVPAEVQVQYLRRLFASIGIEAFYDNQSAAGFFYRLFTKNPYTRGLLDAPRLAKGFYWAFSAVAVGGYVWILRRCRDGESFETLLGLTMATLLLIAPHVDTHHHALLLTAFVPLLTREAERFPWAAAFYAFFAVFHPLVSFRFLDNDRLLFAAKGPLQLVLSLPFFMLLGFWMYLMEKLEMFSAKKGA